MEKQDFLNPQNCRALDEAQTPLWFWNDKPEDSELLRQLKLMTDAGVRCTTPHARSGYIGDYMTEDWFGHMKTVIDYKKAHQEPMWLYDEFNWPSGVCNGEVTQDEHMRERYLYFTRTEVPANTRFRAQLQPLGIRLSGDFDAAPKNIFCYDAETMEQLSLEPMLTPMELSPLSVDLKEFELLRERDTVVFQVQILMSPYDEGGRSQLNYLSPEATDRFIELTYEQYNRRFSSELGSTIKAFFNDESRFAHSFPWSENLPAKFIEMKGYDIRTCLPDLVIPGEKAGRTRCDYYDVVAQMFKENYHDHLKNWCERHGMEYTAHLLGEETLGGHTRYSGDFMRQIDAMSRPGVDHLGKGIGSLNVKFTTSAGECYGKEGAQAEVFAGCGWDLTAVEYRRMVCWLYLQGVKTIVNHGFFYSTREERAQDWPPSEFFQWSHWNQMPRLNAMTRRMYGLLTGGRQEIDLLVYHPQESFWLHYLGKQGYGTMYQRGPLLEDDRAAEIDRKEQLLLTGLQQQNIDFVSFPSDAVSNFTVKDGRLVNKLTGASFSVFILPMAEVLPLAVARLLDNFARQGGRLCLMEDMPVYGMRKEDDPEVRAIFEKLKQDGLLTWIDAADDDQQLGDWVRKQMPSPLRILSGTNSCTNNHRCYPEWIIDPVMHSGEDLTGVAYIRYRKGRTREYFFVNFSRGPQTLIVEVPSGSAPEVWDTYAGTIETADLLSEREGIYRLRLILPPNVGIALMTTV